MSSPPASPPPPAADRVPQRAAAIGRRADRPKPDGVEYLDGGALAGVPHTGVRALRTLMDEAAEAR